MPERVICFLVETGITYFRRFSVLSIRSSRGREINRCFNDKEK